MRRIIIVASIILVTINLLISCENEETKVHHEEPAESEGAAIDNKYQQLGAGIAQKTQQSLGSALKNAIGEKGIAGAVAFCNIEALPITDSVSKSLNASIKRVSDRPRNPLNQAREGELFFINMCKQSLSSGKELKPFISEDEKSVQGLLPNCNQSIMLKLPWRPKKYRR